jgi:hypothetical protein
MKSFASKNVEKFAERNSRRSLLHSSPKNDAGAEKKEKPGSNETA